jgi:pSer/pThr/pTyr-binding forkhead associated (FHA) protein
MTAIVLLLIRTTLALALYLFLGWALITLWRDLQQQKISIQSERLPEISLGIQMGDEAQEQVFQQTEITIGRDPACECILKSETVSARHARFTHHHGQWWLEDLESTNGTLINGVSLTRATVVIPGDQIYCGEAKIIILENEAPSQ